MVEIKPVPGGTSSPWRMLEDGRDDPTVWVRDDGWSPGPMGLLAETLRLDGPARTLGPALEMAAEAELELGFIGRLDDGNGDEALCTETGSSVDNEEENAALWSLRKSVIARVTVIT